MSNKTVAASAADATAKKYMSFKEIADVTDVSINTALGRMRYALINLRKIVKEKNIILSA